MAESLPRHIAIIMDGNGRWAQQRSLPRILGHKTGVDAVKRTIKACVKRKIAALTLFTFSSENWQRPEQEVEGLMRLFIESLQKEIKELHQNGVCIKIIGEKSAFSEKLQQEIEKSEQLTKDNKTLVLAIAANYGGHWDIKQACQKVTQDVIDKKYTIDAITEEKINQYISLSDIPEPDLFIRTGGEQRISNFLLWQLAYTELYFTKLLWPDFNEVELDKALEDFAGRQRRFGKVND